MDKTLIVSIIFIIIVIGLLIFLAIRNHKEKYVNLAGNWYFTYQENGRSKIGAIPFSMDSKGHGIIPVFNIILNIDTENKIAKITFDNDTVTSALLTLSNDTVKFHYKSATDYIVLTRLHKI